MQDEMQDKIYGKMRDNPAIIPQSLVKIIPPAYAEGAAKQKTARAKKKTEAAG